MRTKSFAIAAAAALTILSPTAASASATVDTSYGNTVEREDDDRFPWGLLGLLGLLGLIPRKKKETVIDNRTTTR